MCMAAFVLLKRTVALTASGKVYSVLLVALALLRWRATWELGVLEFCISYEIENFTKYPPDYVFAVIPPNVFPTQPYAKPFIIKCISPIARFVKVLVLWPKKN